MTPIPYEIQQQSTVTVSRDTWRGLEHHLDAAEVALEIARADITNDIGDGYAQERGNLVIHVTNPIVLMGTASLRDQARDITDIWVVVHGQAARAHRMI
jgi:hypothetical protein